MAAIHTTAPAGALPVHTFILTASESAAVEKALSCLTRALERLQEARCGASVYGRDALLLAQASAYAAAGALPGALRGVP